MAPTPKPPGQRRRRNAVQGQWRELQPGSRADGVPEPRTDVELGPIGRAFWDVVWSSPMAGAYTVADEFPLTRLAVLVDARARYERGELDSFDGDSEMRQLEDRFGVSPLARRRLQWEIAQAEDEPARRPATVRRLRAVDTASA